jgi:hypothetical protein
MDAAKDENSALFTYGKREQFQDLRDRVQAALLKLHDSAPQVAAGEVPDIPMQIRKLAELHAAGGLSDDEFAAKKTELLSRM